MSHNYQGPITGQELRIDPLEKGMPYRGTEYGHRNGFTKKEDRTHISDRLDFDIYKQTSDHSKNAPEPYLGRMPFTDFNSSDNKVIPELYGTDAGTFLSNKMNKFSDSIHNLLGDRMTQSYCVSGFSLYSMFGTLYYASQDKTEHELYDYFGMIARDNVTEGIQYINKLLQNTPFKSIIFINNIHKTNPQTVKHLSNLVSILPLSTSHADKEYKTINNYIAKISNGNILPISKKVIEEANIICASVIYIKPILPYNFKTFESNFYPFTGDIKKTRMMQANDITAAYYEDNINQYIELKSSDGIYGIGFILSKDENNINVKLDEINFKNMKESAIEELVIPSITLQLKMRLSNIMHQSGLKSVFDQLVIPSMIPQSDNDVFISDIVSNITLIINTNERNKNIPAKKLRTGVSNIRFVCDRTFTFYVRLLKTNTLLVTGRY